MTMLLLWLVLTLPFAALAWGFGVWSKFLTPSGRTIRVLSIGLWAYVVLHVGLMIFRAVRLMLGMNGNPGMTYAVVDVIRQLTFLFGLFYAAGMVVFAAVRMRQFDEVRRRELVTDHDRLLQLKRRITHNVREP